MILGQDKQLSYIQIYFLHPDITGTRKHIFLMFYANFAHFNEFLYTEYMKEHTNLSLSVGLFLFTFFHRTWWT